MRPDRKEPDVNSFMWDDPAASIGDQAFEPASSMEELNELEPSVRQHQQPPGLHLSNPGLTEDEPINLIDEPAEPASGMGDVLQMIGQYVTLVLAPLLFGGLTSLFVLPLVVSGQAAKSGGVGPAGVWFVVLAIVLIAIGQGIAVYYAGTNNNLWAMATLIGFFLFVLTGCFTVFGLVSGLIVLFLMIAICVGLAKLYLHAVPEGTVDIVYSYGKYTRTLYPGANILLPWEKVVRRLNTTDMQWSCPVQRIQWSHGEDVSLGASITYQLLPEDAHLALTQVNNWEKQLQDLFVSTLQTVATKFTPDDFIAWPEGLHSSTTLGGQPVRSNAQWDHINAYLFHSMRDKVALWGIQVKSVNIRDVELVPHGKPAPNTEPVKSVQANEVKGAAASATAQPAAKASEKPAQPASAAAKQAPTPLEDALMKAYEAVQKGQITDPDTIRGIAERFDDIARDSQKSQTVMFDANRAASNLRGQARKYEARFGVTALYEDEAQTGWGVHRATDENMLAGG